MKKLLTFSLAFMLAVLFNTNAIAQTLSHTVYPAEAYVTEISEIIVTFDQSAPGNNFRAASTGIFDDRNGNNLIQNISSKFDRSDSNKNYHFKPSGGPITTPGTYTFKMAAGSVTTSDGKTKNAEIKVVYTVIPSCLTHTVIPAEGTVREISEITVVFNAETGYANFDKETTGIFDSNGVNLINNPNDFIRNTNEKNRITFKPSSTITEPGVYTFKIPAGAITTENNQYSYNGARNNNIEVVYTVVEEPLEMGAVEDITPAVGSTVMELSTITIPFAEPAEVVGNLEDVITLGGQPVTVTMSEDGYTATITSEETFDTGEVVLSIPEGFFKQKQGSGVNAALSYSWNLVRASLAIEDFHIYKGYTQEITINLTNGIDFSGFQADLTLPEGLTVVENKFTLNRGVEGNHVLQSNVLKSSGKTRLLCYPTKKVDGKMPILTGESGDALVTFTVQASANFTDDEIVVDGIVLSTADGDPYMLSEAKKAAVEAREYATEIIFTNAPDPEKAFETGEATPEDRPFTATVNAGAYNDDIKWTVEPAEGVITFENGIITAVGVGQATITATALGAAPGQTVAKSCTVEVVYTHATAITIQPKEVLFEVDDHQTLTATLDKTTNKAKEIVWTSNNPAVAEIVINEETGEVEVVGIAIGETTVVAQIKNGNEPVLKATIPVKVDATMATTLKVNPAQVKLETGGQTPLEAIVDDDATNPKISWYVEEGGEEYVLVNDNGVVTALKVTPAPVKVYAATGDGSGLTAFSEVTVVATLVENVTIALANPNDDNELMNTETVRLVANLTGTTNKKTLWTSSDEAMATVEVVEGVAVVTAGSKTGEVTIFATIEGSNIRGEYTLTIIPTPATEIAINYKGETKFETGAGQVTLTATVGPELATDKTVTWTSSDEEIATVANGVVTFGEKLGVVIITAKANGAADSQEVKETINFEVVHTFATSVEIKEAQESIPTLKAADNSKNTFKLTAVAAPETNKDIVWTSSNTDVATVVNGLVTAVGVGQATITATIEGTKITDSRVITVAATPGDVNNDGTLDIFDIQLLVGYIMEADNLPDYFVEAAADYNGDKFVNVADVIALSYIALEDEGTIAEANARMYRTRQYADSSNSLFIEDFTIVEGETKQIAIMLNNNAAFSAFQADIFLPEGLEIVEATLSDRKADHTLASAMRNNGSVRLLSYSMGLNAFAGSEGELVYLTVKAEEGFVGGFQIEIDNIKFATVDFAEYYLEPTVANVNGVNITGIEDVEGDEFEVKVVGNTIVAPEGAEVYDLNGLRVNAENLAKGIYIVKVGNQIVKVII